MPSFKHILDEVAENAEGVSRHGPALVSAVLLQRDESGAAAARLWREAEETEAGRFSEPEVAKKAEELAAEAPATSDSVAADLGPMDGLSAAQLEVVRRRYMLRHHPDLQPPDRQEAATRRVAFANMLIDRAVRGVKRRRG